VALTEETKTRPARERSLAPAGLADAENKVLRVGYGLVLGWVDQLRVRDVVGNL
jgi:hypothetical protein